MPVFLPYPPSLLVFPRDGNGLFSVPLVWSSPLLTLAQALRHEPVTDKWIHQQMNKHSEVKLLTCDSISNRLACVNVSCE